MGKAKRFNSYDSAVATDRRQAEAFGQGRMGAAGYSSSFGMGDKGKMLNNKQTNVLGLQNGGQLRGPIGFASEVGIISAGNVLDLTLTGASTVKQLRGLIYAQSGTSSTIDEIVGKRYQGQMVIVTGISGQTAITITHGSGLAGQVLCPGDVDYTLADDESVILIDDATAGVQSWRILSGSIATASGGVTESSNPVVWTGTHSFNGAGTSINSATIMLGDVDTDNLFITAKIASTLIPDADNTYSLGTSSLEWRDLHVDGTGYIDAVQAVAVTATGSMSCNGTTILGDSSVDSINFNGNIDTDVVIDGGKRVRSYDTQEIGLQVTNDSITTGTEGTLQIPWLGASSSTKAAADTDFGNATACIGINEIGGTPILLARKSDGTWWGVALSSYFP